MQSARFEMKEGDERPFPQPADSSSATHHGAHADTTAQRHADERCNEQMTRSKATHDGDVMPKRPRRHKPARDRPPAPPWPLACRLTVSAPARTCVVWSLSLCVTCV